MCVKVEYQISTSTVEQICGGNDLQIPVPYIDRLVQEKRNCIDNALELHISCTNPSIWGGPN